MLRRGPDPFSGRPIVMTKRGTKWRTVCLTAETMDILLALSEMLGPSPRDTLSVVVRDAARKRGLLPDLGERERKEVKPRSVEGVSEPPKPRKPRRRGQIRARGPNKWLVRVFLGKDPQGKRHYVSRTIEGDRKQAERALELGLARADFVKARHRSPLWREVWSD